MTPDEVVAAIQAAETDKEAMEIERQYVLNTNKEFGLVEDGDG